MTPDDIRLSLFEVSSHLGVSPSAVKKRVVNLNLPVLRGARGKLIFDARAYALLQQADELLKAGHGFEECRRQLGLEAPPSVAALPVPVAVTDPIKLFRAARRVAMAEPVTEAPVAAATDSEIAPEPTPVTEAMAQVAVPAPAAPSSLSAEPSVVTGDRPIDTEPVAPSALAGTPTARPSAAAVPPAAVSAAPAVTAAANPLAAADTAGPAVTEAPVAADEASLVSATDDFPAAWPAALQPADTGKVRALPPPVMVKLGRSKSAPPLSPDMLARLDAALRLLDDKDRQNQMLQSKLLVAYDEMTKLSATAAAFQERSLNLAHEVQKLQGEMRLLAAPPSRKPWWKLWT